MAGHFTFHIHLYTQIFRAAQTKVDGLAGDARCGWCDGECSECAEVLVRLVQTRMWPRPSLWVPY